MAEDVFPCIRYVLILSFFSSFLQPKYKFRHHYPEIECGEERFCESTRGVCQSRGIGSITSHRLCCSTHESHSNRPVFSAKRGEIPTRIVSSATDSHKNNSVFTELLLYSAFFLLFRL